MRIATLVLAAVAGFAGGSLSSHVSVYAQGPGAEILRSREFVLTDSAGRKRGEWMIDSSGQTVLRTFDTRGRLTWDSLGTPRPQGAGGSSLIPDR
jgi:hypothetical protein